MSEAQPTLLIVDDTPTNLQVLLNFLQSFGFRVLIATDGKQALERATLGRPDLILLDVMMPDIDGFETCRRLKQDQNTAEIPIIFMTALGETENKVEGFEAGGIDYVTKPLDHQEVLVRVRTHLTLRQLQQSLTEQNARLQTTTAQLEAIGEALTRFLQTGRMGFACAALVANALRETGSQVGLSGVLLGRRQKDPRFGLLAIEGKLNEAAAAEELHHEIENQGYADRPLEFVGEAVSAALHSSRVINNPTALSPGAASLLGDNAVLAVPVLLGTTAAGVLAVSGREGGYGASQQAALENLARAAGILLECERSRRREAAAERKRLQAEEDVTYLQEEIKDQRNFDEIVGTSEALHNVLGQVRQVASTDSTVFIHGETGTGKELIARALHNASGRKERPLITMNCAALPENLVESELFGHERGAFTGATAQHKGRFELADGGTLFLDEIGDMPLNAQSKLLRVLQEKTFERIGGRQPLTVDVRILAASHRDLAELVADGGFRQDLYYRLNVFPIVLPPLRARPEDVGLLAQHFVRRFAARFGRPIQHLGPPALSQLQSYNWPGNVRELENVIERAVILSDGSVLELPPGALSGAGDGGRSSPAEQPVGQSGTGSALPSYADRPTLDEMQRRYIEHVLAATNWVVEGSQGAAQILGLNPSTLRHRIQKLGVRKASGSPEPAK